MPSWIDFDREVIGNAHKENVRVQTVRYHAAMLAGDELIGNLSREKIDAFVDRLRRD